ncbi:MAG: hypothetical protein FJX74_00945 [Armatimonadetes bacterium]|nr:hypothetical protein [Armatimonadota bacterium]
MKRGGGPKAFRLSDVRERGKRCACCPMAECGDAFPTMCEQMHGYLWTILHRWRQPMLACCAAGGKELATPLADRSGRIVDAAIYPARSPREDTFHLKWLAAFTGVAYQDLVQRWSALPVFSAEFAAAVAEQAEGRDGLRPVGSGAMAERYADDVRRLGAAYDTPAYDGRSFYDLDMRVFRMIAGLRSLPGVTGVDAAYIAQPLGQPLLRYFSRNLGPVLPLTPPISGLCLSDPTVPRDLRRYVARAGRVAREPAGGRDTIASRTLGLGEHEWALPRWVHTVDLSAFAPRPDMGGWVAGADVYVTHPHGGLADVVRDCLAAASDGTEQTALRLVHEGLAARTALRWDEARQTTALLAHALSDPTRDGKADWWSEVLSAVASAMRDVPYARVSERRRVIGACRGAVDFLAGCVTRERVRREEAGRVIGSIADEALAY